MKTLNSINVQIGDTAKIIISGETGEVIGRAEYKNSEPQLLLAYKAADGRAVEAWWYVSQVEVV